MTSQNDDTDGRRLASFVDMDDRVPVLRRPIANSSMRVEKDGVLVPVGDKALAVGFAPE